MAPLKTFKNRYNNLLCKYIIRGDLLCELRNCVILFRRFYARSHADKSRDLFSFYYEHRFVMRIYVITFYYSRRTSMRRLLYNFARILLFDWHSTTLWCRLQCRIWSMNNLTRPWMNVDISVLCAAHRQIMQRFLYQPLTLPAGHGMFACKAIHYKVSV